MWTEIDYMYNVSEIIKIGTKFLFYRNWQYKDFTVDPNHFSKHSFSEFLDKLHNSGRQYGVWNFRLAQECCSSSCFAAVVVIIDPGINNADGYKPYQDGVAQDVFIKV